MNLKKQIRCEMARREFWEYCRLKAPEFYKKDRSFLKEVCDELQTFFYSEDQFLLICLPPRHGKSRTAGLFVEWILGKDTSLKIMTASYNETLSTVFSRSVRSSIQELKADDNRIVYNDIFPNTCIKYGEAAANLWSLEGNSTKNYLATSPSGSATGFGADIICVDDIIKNAKEANNATTLDGQWEWFINTMLSRLEGKRKIIIIMTRWATRDLAGRALEHFDNIGIRTRMINMRAYDNNKMLCDEILNKEQYDILSATISQDILHANYNQEPIDLKGVLYSRFMEYKTLPNNIKGIFNYTDTADTGEDYLCSITFAIDSDDYAYILDVIYTQQPMEITEILVADKLTEFNVNWARIESNSGGRGFSRNVERICRKKGNRVTIFQPFHQSQNKVSRILTGASGVMLNIYFPRNWSRIWEEFHKDIIMYQRQGKNKHDDGPDALTGVYETIEKQKQRQNLSGLRL